MGGRIGRLVVTQSTLAVGCQQSAISGQISHQRVGWVERN